jgi:hypothetical protein|tara:strand:- start:274 stop:612 length:339 start_codon:yes stop_codon:yes gene_type:complete
MRKVKIIEAQKEEVREVTGSEAEELLRKYGYGQEDKQISTRLPDKKDTSKLTFEELIKLHEEEQSALKAKKENKNPISFEAKNGYDKEIKNVSDDGFNFKVEITTDMKLPKY